MSVPPLCASAQPSVTVSRLEASLVSYQPLGRRARDGLRRKGVREGPRSAVGRIKEGKESDK